jgi:hypothetical protein
MDIPAPIHGGVGLVRNGEIIRDAIKSISRKWQDGDDQTHSQDFKDASAHVRLLSNLQGDHSLIILEEVISRLCSDDPGEDSVCSFPCRYRHNFIQN